MDAGADVLDELDYDERNEFSSVQHGLNLLYTVGMDAFMSEFQMSPVRQTSLYELTPSMVTRAVNGVDHLTIPDGCHTLIAAIDVMNASGLRWCITAFGRNRVAAVISYGRYPSNNEPLYIKSNDESKEDSAVDRALTALCQMFASKKFPCANGGFLRISAVGIDMGWKTGTVSKFVKRNAGLFAKLHCMKGFGGDTFRPFAKSGVRNEKILSSDEWAYSAEGSYGEFIGFHHDYWMETMQRAWLNQPLQPGSLSLFGREPHVHHVFAQEVCGDKLLTKDSTREGKKTWKWQKGCCHFADATKMALVLAYWHRRYQIYEIKKTVADVMRGVSDGDSEGATAYRAVAPKKMIVKNRLPKVKKW